MEPLRRAQARELDRLAMDEFGIPGLILMENACRGVADAAAALAGPEAGVIAIVCGRGNNGGDGYGAARHLFLRGYRVRLLPVEREPPARGSDARVQFDLARTFELPFANGVNVSGAAVVVDALLGTGVDRPLGPPYDAAIRAINAARARVLAVDVPTGLDADSGHVLGVAVRADVTATMVAPKAGFALREGPAHCGEVRVVDIGIPPRLLERVRAGS